MGWIDDLEAGDLVEFRHHEDCRCSFCRHVNSEMHRQIIGDLEQWKPTGLLSVLGASTDIVAPRAEGE